GLLQNPSGGTLLSGGIGLFSHVRSGVPPVTTESYQPLKSSLKLGGSGKPPSCVIKPLSKRGACVSNRICKPLGLPKFESVPLYSTPIKPGMISPTLRPVLAKTQWSSGAPIWTTISPSVGTLLTHKPPTTVCSDAPIQVKVHRLFRHARFVGQSVSS